jgi:hypothetical protein
MKKFLLLMVVIVSLLPKANAQEGPENVMFLNLGYTLVPLATGLVAGGYGFGLGADYEKYITDYFTIGATIGFMYIAFDFQGSTLDFTLVDVIPEFRYYPRGTATKGLFLAARIGYEFMLSKYQSVEEISNIFIVTPLIGYKFVWGDSFVLEIAAGYELELGTINLPNSIPYDYSSGGFTYGIAFGWGWN